MAVLPFSVVAIDPIVRAFGQLSRFLLKLRAVVVVLQMAGLWFVTARYWLVVTLSVVAGTKIIEQIVLTWRTVKTLGVVRSDLVLPKDVARIGAMAAGAAVLAAVVRLAMNGAPAWAILILGGAVFALTYVLGLWFAGILTPEERQDLARRVRVRRSQNPLRRLAEPQAF